jgi:two-component system, LytTR family, sensor kinase
MRFWKIISPGLYGLLIYFTIRIINDTVAEFRFWERHWSINTIEIVTSIGMGYFIWWALRKTLLHFDSQSKSSFRFRNMINEILWVSLFTEIIMSITIIPMAALTDDGLSWGDVATIYLIPLMFSIIFYTIIRSKKLLEAYVENRIQLERIQNEHLNTELKFLKAQYHPHFLFNALNTIYFKMDESLVDAKKLVEKFSDLLRYQLYDQQQKVTVRNELDYLEAYIDLQKERMTNSSLLEVEFDQRLNGEKIYPLLFLPLVENAFKYAGGNNRIMIRAKLENEDLVFEVSNSTGNMRSTTQVGGIGLENLKRRLDLLYPGKYNLEFTEIDKDFSVRLRLKTIYEN